MSETVRERIVRLVNEMRNRTVDRGCTPAEAAGFAAKVAEYIEKYQIDEAELKSKDGTPHEPDLEVCENKLRTGKKAFNPGMTQVVAALARGMCCEPIMMHEGGEAVYGITGDVLDADYVCQVATAVVPALQVMAALEGREHGHEKAGLVRWSNQYLAGAAQEIQRRLEDGRKARSLEKMMAAPGAGALVVVTGETIAKFKKVAVAAVFRKNHPRTRTQSWKHGYNPEAQQRGREAGKRVGLNLSVED